MEIKNGREDVPTVVKQKLYVFYCFFFLFDLMESNPLP